MTKVAEKHSSRKRTMSVILIWTGVSLGLLLSTLAAWADYESTAYGFMRRAQTPFTGLTCPIFIGKDESSTISVRVYNPTDETLSPAIRTELSTPQELEANVDSVKLAPGERASVQRSIGPQNIDLGSFIFVYALVYSAYPLPYQENTCGVLVLPVKNGGQLLIFGTTLSLLSMAAGMFLTYRDSAAARQNGPMSFLVLMTVAAMALGLMGAWLPAGVVIVVSVLTFVITIGNYLR